MQQPNNYQDQLGCQQAMSQQMMLCPVRLVYETQILVPPGDQVQPNQTFFVNPQNPPPWMQNRQVPNQVVYVQQLPNNIVQSVPIDQNQLYLQQNFGNYQIQQQMLQQNPQEIRQMQIANLVPNIVQAVQQTLSNDRHIGQISSINQIQSNPQNQIQNQINYANARIPQMKQNMEVPRQVYIRQPINQPTLTRPVMAMNQMQNLQIPQTLTNLPNVQLQQVTFGQTLSPNIGQTKNTQTQNMSSVPRVVKPSNTYANQAHNYPNMQSVLKLRHTPPIDVNKSVNNTVAQSVAKSMPIISSDAGSPLENARNFIPNRPIQPRPQSRHVNNMTVQHRPVSMQDASTYTITNANKSSNTAHNVVYPHSSNAYTNTPDNNISRKRKSESPDEIQKKLAVAAGTRPNYQALRQSITVTKLSNEIGVNTSTVHTAENKLGNNTIVQINPTSAQLVKMVDKVPQQDSKLIKNTVTDVKLTDLSKSIIPSHLIEKEKMIRNTVFTQARGRLLQDKNCLEIEVKKVSSDAAAIIETTQPTVSQSGSDKISDVPLEPVAVSEIPKAIRLDTQVDKNYENELSPINAESPITIKTESDLMIDEKDIDEVYEFKLEEDDKNTIKQESEFNILTHVVDGYVIQESNIAFPIRKPLKEKIIIANTPSQDKAEYRVPIDLPLLPLHYLHLNNKASKKRETKEETNDKGNPFLHLQQATVKSWTIEDLTKHLSKYEWKETIAALQEHEIDGESLFLVSKPQLLTIGVPEDHAEVICDFVKG